MFVAASGYQAGPCSDTYWLTVLWSSPIKLQAWSMLMNVHVCVAQAVCQATAQPTPLSGPHTGAGDPRSHHTTGNVDSLSLYAKAYARQSGQQLKVLGEAGFKYLSGAVENWRAAATDHGSKDKFPAGGLVLFFPNHLVAG